MTNFIKKSNYGLSGDNPIKLKNSESVITMLKHIVTDSGFHLLFHFKDYISNEKSIIEVYEIFSGVEEFYLLYFEVTKDINVWLPPSGFLFKHEWIEHGESNFIYHGQDYYYKGDESVDSPFDYFHLRNWKVLKIYLSDNYGVNYTGKDFPHSVFQKYYDNDYSNFIKD